MRLFLILSLMSFSLFASYEKVQELYKAKKYDKAIAEAKASTSEFSNVQLHLLWAKSAEVLGRVQEAMAAYERVVLLDSQNVDARIALVGIYSKTNRNDLSDEMREELDTFELSKPQQRLLASYETDKSSKIKLYGSFALGYDTNVNTSPGEEVLNNYLGVAATGGEKGSSFGRLSANVNYTDMIDSGSNWYYRGDAKVFLQNNIDMHAYDFLYGSIGAGIGYKGNGYNLYLPVSYNRVYFLQTDLFDEYTFSPKINYIVSRNFIVNLNTQYVKRTYIHEGDRGLNEKIYRYGAGAFYMMGKNYLYFNIFRDDFVGDDGANSVEYVNRKAITLNLGVQYSIVSNLNLAVDYRYRNSKYDNFARISSTLLSSQQRSDNFHQFELKLSRSIAENLELYFSNQYSTNNSNYSLVEYHKNVTMFGISAEY